MLQKGPSLSQSAKGQVHVHLHASHSGSDDTWSWHLGFSNEETRKPEKFDWLPDQSDNFLWDVGVQTV